MSEAECTAWVEGMLGDLDKSGDTGADIAKRFRDYDAALMKGTITTCDGTGFCLDAPDPGVEFAFDNPFSGGAVLPGSRTVWLGADYADYMHHPQGLQLLADIGHELTHLVFQNEDRYSIRGEAQAYANEAKILNDLKERTLAVNDEALSVDLNSKSDLEAFRTSLVTWTCENGFYFSCGVYKTAPLGPITLTKNAPTLPTKKR